MTEMKDSIDKLVSLLVITALVLVLGISVCGESATAQDEWYVYPGDSIQDAVDNASAGDIIYVHEGTYVENVEVHRSNLTLIGDGRDFVIVDAIDMNSHTFCLTADGITMSGFSTTGSYNCGYAGICLEDTNFCRISNNSCFGNLCAGIYLRHSDYCIVENNNISDNDCGGLKLHNCNNNIVRGNWLENNLNMGLDVFGESNDNIIYNNYVDKCRKNAIDSKYGANRWNITNIPGTNIVGGPYLGGNYWGDYNGTDDDGDGFGDTPYDVKDEPGEEVNNMDYLPLLKIESPPVDDTHNEGQNETPGFQVLLTIAGLLAIILLLRRKS